MHLWGCTLFVNFFERIVNKCIFFFFWFCWSHIITKWFQPLFNEHGEWQYSCFTFFKLWRQSDDLFNSFINFTFKSIIIKKCKSKLMFSWTFLLFLACLYGSSTSKTKLKGDNRKGSPQLKEQSSINYGQSGPTKKSKATNSPVTSGKSKYITNYQPFNLLP